MKVKFFLVCVLLSLLVSCTDDNELIEQQSNEIDKSEIKSTGDEDYIRKDGEKDF